CFYTVTASAETHTRSLHDALPICWSQAGAPARAASRYARSSTTQPSGNEIVCRLDDVFVTRAVAYTVGGAVSAILTSAVYVTPSDRKSTRLNSSHVKISYAVFCLK